MVLINDKKYSCATCIKGHRSGSCTHTDRPLHEVKKKGRPVTQCEHCRKLRSEKQVHIRCECAGAGPAPKKPPQKDPSTAAFPNGLRDVHAMNDAADALSAMQNGSSCCGPTDNKLRKLDALLNPCQCQSGGKCKCCQPVVGPSASQESSCCNSNSNAGGEAFQPTGEMDGLADVLRREMSVTPMLDRRPSLQVDMQGRQGITPSSHHHPSHSSRHVHKTSLYSPYPGSHKGAESALKRTKSLSRTVSGRASPVTPHVHHDMPVTLPRIREADSEQAIDLTLPAIFPTVQSWDMDGCTCGEGCLCPGCTTHPNNDSNRVKAEGAMDGVNTCPSTCTSCFDCQSHLNVQPGVQSIQHLIDIAASSIPPPAQLRTPYSMPSPSSGLRSPMSAFELDPTHMGILPPNALWNDEAANAMGLVKLKPLECCNGRCQCSPGMCQCLDDCCGCCSTCPCGPDGNDGEKKLENDGFEPTNESLGVSEVGNDQVPDSCCSGNKGGNPIIAEVIEISDESSVGDRTERAASKTVTPLMEWADPMIDPSLYQDGIELAAQAPDPKSCCSKKTETTDRAGVSRSNSVASSKRSSISHAHSVRTGKGDKSASDTPRLSRAPSASKGSIKSHTASHPRPIMPRPTSQQKQDAIAVVRSAGGMDHNITVQRSEKAPVAASSRNQSGTSTPSIYPPAHMSGSRHESNHNVTRPDAPIASPQQGDCCTKKAMPPNLFDLVAQLPFNPWTGQPNEHFVANTTPAPRREAATPAPVALGTSSQSSMSLSSPELARAAVFLMMQQQQQQHQQQQEVQQQRYEQQQQAREVEQETQRLPELSQQFSDQSRNFMFPASNGHVPPAILPPDNLAMPTFAENGFMFPDGMPYSSYNAAAGSASTSNPPALNGPVGSVPMQTNMFDASNPQDCGPLDTMFERYLQGVADGQIMIGADSQFDVSGQSAFMSNAPNGTFDFGLESQDLQQIFDNISPQSLNAMLSQALSEQPPPPVPTQGDYNGSSAHSSGQAQTPAWTWS